MNMLKVACSSYLNAKPFVYGLLADAFRSYLHVSIEPPAICKDAFVSGNVDIALIPIVELPKNLDYQIVTNYCIGAINSVYSVCLFANEPIDVLKKIYLDKESRTSVKLLKLLSQEYWKINPEFIFEDFSPSALHKKTGCLLIGNKTFEQHSRFAYIYDLAREWRNYIGLPFVFAVWVAQKNISNADVDFFNEALSFGVNNIDSMSVQWQMEFKNIDVFHYLKTNIDYVFDNHKKNAMNLFLTKINNLNI
jgi:chorismate dehydratase